jgi:hypothetical protein
LITIYLVVDDFDREGLAFHEVGLDRTNLESVIRELMAGPCIDPVRRVMVFNRAERWLTTSTKTSPARFDGALTLPRFASPLRNSSHDTRAASVR